MLEIENIRKKYLNFVEYVIVGLFLVVYLLERVGSKYVHTVAITAIVISLWVIWERKGELLKKHSFYMWVPLVVFWVFLLPSVIWSSNSIHSLKWAWRYAIYWPMPFVIINFLVKQKRVGKIALVMMSLLFSCECMWCMYKYLSGIENRATGVNSDAPVLMMAAMTCVFFVIFYVEFLKTFGKNILCMLNGMGCVLCGGAFIATESRASWLLAIFLIVVIGCWCIRNVRKRLCMVTALVLILMFPIVTNTHLRERLLTSTNVTDNYSNVARIYAWRDAYEMFKKHPITGIGVREWHYVYSRECKSPYKGAYLYHSHNVFMQQLAEGGLFGLYGYIFLMGSLILWNWKLLRCHNMYAFIAFWVLISFNMYGMIDNIMMWDIVMRPFWIILGLLMCLAKIEGERDY